MVGATGRRRRLRDVDASVIPFRAPSEEFGTGTGRKKEPGCAMTRSWKLPSRPPGLFNRDSCSGKADPESLSLVAVSKVREGRRRTVSPLQLLKVPLHAKRYRPRLLSVAGAFSLPPSSIPQANHLTYRCEKTLLIFRFVFVMITETTSHFDTLTCGVGTFLNSVISFVSTSS